MIVTSLLRFARGSLMRPGNFTAQPNQAVVLSWFGRYVGPFKDAGLRGKPVRWSQALDVIGELNRRNLHGSSDWRLPDINALESLVDCSQAEPALPDGHPFRQVREAYWSSTTSFFETDWAWALYLHKGALGVGHKKGESFFVWPVRVSGEQG